MLTHKEMIREMAKRSIEDAECGAQLEIKDVVLREALIISIERQLEKAYQLAACS